MAIDLKGLQSQLLGTFFEESFEGLERLESGLLRLEAEFDEATVNDIFRAAHSIKGAAGTFGFSHVTEFAHDMETLLDGVRAGTMTVQPELTSLLLEAVDVLRRQLEALRDGGDGSLSEIGPLRARLQAAVRRDAPDVGRARAEGAAAPTTPAAGRWRITFAPRPGLLESGNEPWRLLRELEQLGTAAVTCDLSRLPALADLQPTTCYLAWRITLDGTATRAAIEDVFSWVADDCELTIEALAGVAAPAAAPSAETVRPVAGAIPSRRRDDGGDAVASLRVGVDKVDFLMNMVGELVITQSMLGQIDDDGPLDPARTLRLREGLAQLARNSRALQESVMRLRSMPISVVFNRFPRLVHDLGKQLGKRVELAVVGQGTELDKTVLEKLGDPLVHLVRNSLDHGLETPEERAAAGKPETGTLTLGAFHRGGDIVIEVRDDGRGLDAARILAKARERGLVGADETPSDAEITNLIFAPGFSTAAAVTDVSGRGVGMDVVRRNVKALGGDITVDSTPGRGTKISLRLPLTLAIIDGQLVEAGSRPYVVPLLSIVESVQIDARFLRTMAGQGRIYRMRDQLMPVIDLAAVLGGPPAGDDLSHRLLMVVEGDGQRLGLVVDELKGQQQIVVKSLEANFGRVPGLSGATILGDGSVAFILDMAGLAKLAKQISGIRRAA
jgi:two-component system chemotaxis sensor kinase CheA